MLAYEHAIYYVFVIARESGRSIVVEYISVNLDDWSVNFKAKWKFLPILKSISQYFLKLVALPVQRQENILWKTQIRKPSFAGLGGCCRKLTGLFE